MKGLEVAVIENEGLGWCKCSRHLPALVHINPSRQYHTDTKAKSAPSPISPILGVYLTLFCGASGKASLRRHVKKMY